ncbi:hypothetical protein WJX77_002555 [Trebouxia sp. C0004]
MPAAAKALVIKNYSKGSRVARHSARRDRHAPYQGQADNGFYPAQSNSVQQASFRGASRGQRGSFRGRPRGQQQYPQQPYPQQGNGVSLFCNFCKRNNHTEDFCFMKHGRPQTGNNNGQFRR